MRNILTLVIIICVCISVWPVYNPDMVKHPAPLSDSCDISLYGQYMAFFYPGMSYYNFRYDHSVILPDNQFLGYSGDTIGLWRMHNDTLLIYENYFSEGQEKDMTQEELDYYSQFFYCGDAYRGIVTHLDTWGIDYPFPANVSALKVKDYGNEIVYLTDTNRGLCSYVPVSMYKYHNWRNLAGGSIWNYSKFDWRHGEFLVRKKTEASKQTLIVDIEKDGILFRIVNPQYYLKHDTVKYYDPDDEHALNGWMDSVEIGRRYRFALQRPDYPADSASHVRYLRTLPDSIYISSPIAHSTEPLPKNHEQFPDTCREAYGYFFARMMR